MYAVPGPHLLPFISEHDTQVFSIQAHQRAAFPNRGPDPAVLTGPCGPGIQARATLSRGRSNISGEPPQTRVASLGRSTLEQPWLGVFNVRDHNLSRVFFPQLNLIRPPPPTSAECVVSIPSIRRHFIRHPPLSFCPFLQGGRPRVHLQTRSQCYIHQRIFAHSRVCT